MRKLLLITLPIILLCGRINVFANQDKEQNTTIFQQNTFSEIILGELLKDDNIRKINHLVEKVEASLNPKELQRIEESIKKEINLKKEPQFLYFYFLARVYCAYANLYQCSEDKTMIEKYLEEALKICKKAKYYNKNFSDICRLLSDIYGRLIPLKGPMIYGPFYGFKANRENDLAIKLNPQNPEAYLAKGRMYFYTPVGFGGSKKDALKYFKKATQVCPNYYMSYMWLGIWYLDRGEKDEAKQYFKKVLELKPDFGWAEYQLMKLEGKIK